MIGLDGQRVLVLGGGGQGIGRAITERLAEAGCLVAVADIDKDRADEAAAGATAAGGDARGYVVDVRSRDQLDELFLRVAADFKGLDTLVTVVGGQLAFVPFVPLHEISDEDWDLMFELNLRYVARAVKGALRVFLTQERGGTIVSIGSIAALAASPLQAAYGAAKAGLASLARSVAAEYGGRNIRMNVLSCGPIATPVASPAQDANRLDWIPIGRAGSTKEVADAAIFLASPASSYINGQTLVLDGGATAAGPFPRLAPE